MRSPLLTFAVIGALACGAEAIPDRSSCEATSRFPRTVDHVIYPLYESCQQHRPAIDPSAVTLITSAEDFASLFACAVDDVEVDFVRARIAVVAFPENPQAEVLGAHIDGDRILLQLGAPSYCGGAPPEDSILVIAIPSGSNEVYAERCTWGACEGPDRP